MVNEEDHEVEELRRDLEHQMGSDSYSGRIPMRAFLSAYTISNGTLITYSYPKKAFYKAHAIARRFVLERGPEPEEADIWEILWRTVYCHDIVAVKKAVGQAHHAQATILDLEKKGVMFREQPPPGTRGGEYGIAAYP